MSDTTLKLINAIAAGDALETEAAFNASMAEKISAKLDDMRMNVAKNMFVSQEEQEVSADAEPTEVEEPTQE